MENRIELLKQSFMNSPVKIMVTEETHPITLPDGKIFSAKKGKKEKFPDGLECTWRKRGLLGEREMKYH